MIDNYNSIMDEWSAPSVGCCTNMVEINPDCDMRRWAVQRTITVLANADYYYTKDEVDYLLEQATKDGVTREEVEQMIQRAIASKANQSDLDALAEQVSANTQSILNTYTKQETNALLEGFLTKIKANEMFANYTKVEDTTLILNAENLN
ncbi:MAG: transposase [Methanobrevibacter sp.]|nr:transposase [Methanobrevibacter sp.]